MSRRSQRRGAGEVTDKLRALTDHPELRALMEQFYATPPFGHEPILEAINEKADALYPGWRETIDRAKREGAFLRNAAILCVKVVPQREDLSEFERSRAKDAEVEFKAIFEKALEQGFLDKETRSPWRWPPKS